MAATGLSYDRLPSIAKDYSYYNLTNTGNNKLITYLSISLNVCTSLPVSCLVSVIINITLLVDAMLTLPIPS